MVTVNPDVAKSASKYEKKKRKMLFTYAHMNTQLKDTLHLGKQISHLPIQTTVDSFLKPALLRSHQAQLTSHLPANKYIVFLNKGFKLIFRYLF
jgi:hypothetical protein